MSSSTKGSHVFTLEEKLKKVVDIFISKLDKNCKFAKMLPFYYKNYKNKDRDRYSLQDFKYNFFLKLVRIKHTDVQTMNERYRSFFIGLNERQWLYDIKDEFKNDAFVKGRERSLVPMLDRIYSKMVSDPAEFNEMFKNRYDENDKIIKWILASMAFKTKTVPAGDWRDIAQSANIKLFSYFKTYLEGRGSYENKLLRTHLTIDACWPVHLAFRKVMNINSRIRESVGDYYANRKKYSSAGQFREYVDVIFSFSDDMVFSPEDFITNQYENETPETVGGNFQAKWGNHRLTISLKSKTYIIPYVINSDHDVEIEIIKGLKNDLVVQVKKIEPVYTGSDNVAVNIQYEEDSTSEALQAPPSEEEIISEKALKQLIGKNLRSMNDRILKQYLVHILVNEFGIKHSYLTNNMGYKGFFMYGKKVFSPFQTSEDIQNALIKEIQRLKELNTLNIDNRTFYLYTKYTVAIKHKADIYKTLKLYIEDEERRNKLFRAYYFQMGQVFYDLVNEELGNEQ